MNGTVEVIQIKGIPVKIHWTFLFLLLYVVAAGMYGELHTSTIFLNGLFISAVFGCILLHELGHAFAASYFDIRTLEVIILPVGGVAFIEKNKMNNLQEFIIAFCGPLVNLFIALGIWMFLCVFSPVDVDYITLSDQLSNIGISFSRRLMWINFFIFSFNLIPTLPMDGGVMLRSLLTNFVSTSKAANIQFFLSLLFSVCFLIYSYLFHAVEYLFFAWFLYFTARMRSR